MYSKYLCIRFLYQNSFAAHKLHFLRGAVFNNPYQTVNQLYLQRQNALFTRRSFQYSLSNKCSCLSIRHYSFFSAIYEMTIII